MMKMKPKTSTTICKNKNPSMQDRCREFKNNLTENKCNKKHKQKNITTEFETN